MMNIYNSTENFTYIIEIIQEELFIKKIFHLKLKPIIIKNYFFNYKRQFISLFKLKKMKNYLFL